MTSSSLLSCNSLWKSLPVSTPHCLPGEGDQEASHNNNKTYKWTNVSYEEIALPLSPPPPEGCLESKQAGVPPSTLSIRVLQLPSSTLTRPLRLGRPPTEEATELTELMEELLGLWVKAETPIAIRLVFLALAGLVDGKPIRMTLWMGAKRPNLGGHWKYLGNTTGPQVMPSSPGVSPASPVPERHSCLLTPPLAATSQGDRSSRRRSQTRWYTSVIPALKRWRQGIGRMGVP